MRVFDCANFELCLADTYVSVSTVVLFYDFVITFGREVNLYWSTKVTGASVLLIIIRYYSIIVIIIDLSKTDKVGPCDSCALHPWIDEFLEVCMLSRCAGMCTYKLPLRLPP